MTQKLLFPTSDLPLFSGTPQAGSDPAFTPKDEPQQQTLYSCPICRDTGQLLQIDRKNNIFTHSFKACPFCDAGKDR